MLSRVEGKMAVWKNIKEKGKQYHLPCNIKAFGKNINCGKGEGDGNQDFKKIGVGKNIKL